MDKPIGTQGDVVAARGDYVQILCSAWLPDGTRVDDEDDRDRPQTIRAGQPNRHQEITDAVIGMRVGERRTVTVVAPEEGPVTVRVELLAIGGREMLA